MIVDPPAKYQHQYTSNRVNIDPILFLVRISSQMTTAITDVRDLYRMDDAGELEIGEKWASNIPARLAVALALLFLLLLIKPGIVPGQFQGHVLALVGAGQHGEFGRQLNGIGPRTEADESTSS